MSCRGLKQRSSLLCRDLLRKKTDGRLKNGPDPLLREESRYTTKKSEMMEKELVDPMILGWHLSNERGEMVLPSTVLKSTEESELTRQIIAKTNLFVKNVEMRTERFHDQCHSVHWIIFSFDASISTLDQKVTIIQQ